ncbi:MAG: aminodeoxychorismate/anthranilate synthase component II, partial [Calditrichaeota bacterium]|nr:aminodeoxychorismate/anthranilate synthase component II [Calditrichota bacterium]
MILLVDNYDSFVYNIYQYVASIDKNLIVKRNDQISINEIKILKPDHIILSPGPKHPVDAGICIELIREFYKEIPILGICLGHQAIASA